MKSEVIQFREDRELVAKLRRRRINPNRFAREAFESAIRGLEVEENVRAIRALGIRVREPAARAIRRDRDRR